MNIGKLCQEDATGFVACTPAGIVELIKRSQIETDGKHIVVLGRSQIVGKPATLLMVRKGTLAMQRLQSVILVRKTLLISLDKLTF